MLWFLSGIAIINSCVNGYDGSMMNGMQSLSQWQTSFNHPVGSELGLLNAIFNAGGTCSILVAPFITDKVGRKLGIAIGSTIILIGVILQACSQNVKMFTGARFLVGFGLGISSNSAPILVAELAHPAYRGKITGLYNTQWSLGAIIAAGVTYGTFNIKGAAAWRVPSALQGLFSAILLVFLPFMPESPRWLVDKGRADEARAILGRLHGDGDPNHPLVNLEMQEIEEAIQFEREHQSVSWFELVATSGNRYRMFLGICVGLFSQWSGNGLVSYYLSKILNNIGITDSKKQLQLNLGKECMSWVIANSGALITDRLNRRPQFIIATAGMMITFAGLTGFTGAYNTVAQGNHGVGTGALVFIFLYGVPYGFGWTPLTVLYPTEIMPYHIRAKGLAISTLAVNLALFFNSYINPIGMKAIGWKFYLVYCAWLPVELLVIIFFFKETKGRTLEELAVVFDGEVAAVEGNRRHIDPAAITEKIPGTPPSDLDKEEKEHYENAADLKV